MLSEIDQMISISNELKSLSARMKTVGSFMQTIDKNKGWDLHGKELSSAANMVSQWHVDILEEIKSKETKDIS